MKYILLFFTAFISINTIGQNITIDQFISLRIKSVASVEEFLTSKKWEMVQITEPDDKTKGVMSFAYGKNEFDDKANSFFKLLYSPTDLKNNRISLQLFNINIYTSYLNRIKDMGYKLTSSTIKDDRLDKIYSNKTTTIRVSTVANKEDNSTKTLYLFLICNSTDYLINFTDFLDNVKVDSVQELVVNKPSIEDKRKEADEAFLAEDYSKAIGIYQSILKTTELIELDFYQIGYSYYLTKKYANAITYLKKYVTFDSTNAFTFDLIGSSYGYLEDIPNAIKYTKEAVLLDQNNIEYNTSLSWYYILNKQPKMALEYIEIGESLLGETIDESYYLLMGNKAHVYLIAGKYSEAKELYLMHKGTKINENNDIWESMIIKDLKIFKSKKIWLSHIDELIKLLND